MRSYLQGMRPRRGVVVGVVGALALAALFVPGAAAPAPSTKFYSAAISPTTANAATTTTFTVTIGNCGSSSPAPCTSKTVSTQSIGSANLTFPSGFSSITVVSQTPPAGKTWLPPVVSGNLVQLRNPGPSNSQALSPGQAVSVTVSATVPSALGTYCLTTQTKQSNDFSGNGNDFTRVGNEPCVTVTSPPLDHFGFSAVGNQQAGQTFTGTVAVTAYDSLGHVKTDYAGGPTFGLSGLHTSPGGNAPTYGSVSWSVGVGTVTGMVDYDAETTQLTATDTACAPSQPGHCTGTSNSFTVAPGPLATLSFLTQPADALANTALTPAIQAKAADSYGNPVSTLVSMGLCTASTTPPCPDPSPLSYPSGHLSGNPPQTTDPTTGIATWSALAVDTVGPGYRLLATSGSVNAVGNPFNIADDICTAGNCTVHASSAGAEATVTGTVTGSLSLTLSSGPSSLCGVTTQGDLITVNPVGGSGTLDVSGTFRNEGGNKGGVAHFVICKNTGPGTPFHSLPLCKDDGNVPPCIVKLTGTGTGDVQFEATITPTDPTMGGGH